MDLVLYAIAVAVGAIGSYLIFGRRMGPFEQTIWSGLSQGKRVVVSIDSDAYIFEMYGNRLRITQGYSDFTPAEPYDLEDVLKEYENDRVDADNLDNERSSKSSHSSDSDL